MTRRRPVLSHSDAIAPPDPTSNGREHVNISTKRSKLGRAVALAVSTAMIAGLALISAAPAAAAPGYYSVSGVVDSAGATPLAGVQVSIEFTNPGESGSRYETQTGADGSFAFTDDKSLLPGEYTVEFALEGYGDQSVEFTVVDADVVVGPVTMVLLPEELTAGSLSITGTPVVGNVLTAVTAGWPVGATLSYEWYFSGGNFGGAIDGETAAEYTVTSDLIGRWIGVIVTGSMAGFSDTSVNVMLDAVASTPKKAPAPAPTDLSAYLTANGSTPQSQASAGLPSGAIDPGKAHTANIGWSAPDSFVDVYVFSSPVFVGTFPVVNGVAQVNLSAAVLSQLSAGTHTLVITGQSSGAVQSVTLALGLAATGTDPIVPVTIASLLVLMGAGLLVVRRRIGARV
jgi:5-hydroxyisourate hydrolase-like protein (transthyretin family)